MQFIPTIEKILALIVFLLGTNKNAIIASRVEAPKISHVPIISRTHLK